MYESTTHEKKSQHPLDWQPPIPLVQALAAESPYPIDALPSGLQQAVATYQRYGQQPMALVACTALANLSLACQSLANVARDRYLISPVSLYFLVVASSGERKSAADNVFSNAVRQWELTIRKQREPELLSALTQHKAWQLERDALFTQIKRAAYNNQDSSDYKQLLDELIQQEPEIPIQPTLYFEDCTQEALALHLAHGWPSASLWSDEAGIVLGNHSMQSNPTRFVALLNRLWEGKAFTTHRKSSQSFIIEHRRLTLNLMMQPLLLRQMLTQATGISRQSGFLARCLLAYPPTSMGQRFYQEPSQSIEGLSVYEQRIIECLNESRQLSQAGCLGLPTLMLSPKAKQAWVQFFNGLEAGLKPQGQWTGVRDFASKAAENSARLAALFHLFEGRSGDISLEPLEQAMAVISWHLQETRTLLEPLPTNPALENARKLLDWLLAREPQATTPREILQYSPFRSKAQRDSALEILIEYQHVRLVKTGNKTLIGINPLSQ